MATEWHARELVESDYAAWEAFVAGAPAGSAYSTARYLDTLCTAAGGSFRVVVVTRAGELAAGVALYERAARAGRYVMPRLLLYYNGLVLRRYTTKYPSEQTARDLKAMTLLESELRGAGYAAIELRSRAPITDVRPFVAQGWTALPSYTYVVPTSLPAESWGRVEQNLRRLIERCGAAGLTVTDDDDFDSFFALHAATMERKDVGSYLPAAAFRRYVSLVRERGLGRLFHARLPDGRAVASQLVLVGGHPVSHSVSAAGDPEYNKLGASAFLRWRVCEAVAALGATANDLTDASLNPVTHFKSQLGGDLQLSVVLRRSPTLAYRAEAALQRWYTGAWGLAGAAARRFGLRR